MVSNGAGKSLATMVTEYPASWSKRAELKPITPALGCGCQFQVIIAER